MKSLFVAKRGNVYKWRKDDKENVCVVVSSDIRSSDKLISILFASTVRMKNSRDGVVFELDGKQYMLHTHLVTYTHREFLVEHLGELPEDVMSQVDEQIFIGLLNDNNINYKKLYEELLDKLTTSN